MNHAPPTYHRPHCSRNRLRRGCSPAANCLVLPRAEPSVAGAMAANVRRGQNKRPGWTRWRSHTPRCLHLGRQWAAANGSPERRGVRWAWRSERSLAMQAGGRQSGPSPEPWPAAGKRATTARLSRTPRKGKDQGARTRSILSRGVHGCNAAIPSMTKGSRMRLPLSARARCTICRRRVWCGFRWLKAVDLRSRRGD